MNKRQLVAAWSMGCLMVAVLLFTPKMCTWKEGLLILRKDNEFLAPLVNWSLVFSYLAIIAVIGSLSIYSLRDRKR